MSVDSSPIINGVVGRVERADSRIYADPTDSSIRLDSVTSITGATTAKDYALVPWAAEHTAIAAVDHMDLVQRTAKEVSRQAAVGLLKGESERRRTLKRDIGNHQHDILEALILDLPIPDCPEHLVGIEIDGEEVDQDAISDGLLNFIHDFEPKWEMAEATVANPAHGYAGTLDVVAWFERVRLPGAPAKGARMCLDLKTGNKLYDDHRPQVVAYKNATEVWLDHLGNKAAMPQVDRTAILHVHQKYKRGYQFKAIPMEDEQHYWAWFLNAAATYRSQKDAAQRRLDVFYPPLEDGSQPAPMLADVERLGRYRQPLIDHGLVDLDDVAALTLVKLRQIPGIGPKAPDVVSAALRYHGLTLKGEVA